MTEPTVVVFALLLLAWAVTSAALGRLNITGPLIFTVAGYLVGNPDWGALPIDVDTTSVHTVAEVTLALVLFSDASRVNVTRLRHDLGLPIRLLGIGLPLSVLGGGLLAAALFGDMTWALAGLVGAALAPTDAALSAQVIGDIRIPQRLRRALNVESGLNDGIATPIVAACIAIAAGQLGVESETEAAGLSSALLELLGGLAIGIALGAFGAYVIRVASRRRWMASGAQQIATLAVAVASFLAAQVLDVNGFIAAFAAGAAFGTCFERMRGEERLEEVDNLPELGGQLMALLVWFLFGAALVPVAVDHLSVEMVLYALLSLTVVRMVPVALATLGSKIDRPSIVFVGWFGPRGLASVVFALLAVEELGEAGSPAVDQAIGAIALTVLASVVLHGVTAGPGGRLFVSAEEDQHAEAAASLRTVRLVHQRGDRPDGL